MLYTSPPPLLPQVHLIPRPGSAAAASGGGRRVFETAPFFSFHHANGFECGEGGATVVLDTVANHDGIDLGANFEAGPDCEPRGWWGWWWCWWWWEEEWGGVDLGVEAGPALVSKQSTRLVPCAGMEWGSSSTVLPRQHGLSHVSTLYSNPAHPQPPRTHALITPPPPDTDYDSNEGRGTLTRLVIDTKVGCSWPSPPACLRAWGAPQLDPIRAASRHPAPPLLAAPAMPPFPPRRAPWCSTA